MKKIMLAIGLCLLLSACGSDGGDDEGQDTGGQDTVQITDQVADESGQPDAGVDTTPPEDTTPEVVDPDKLPPLTEPVPLRVGVAGGLLQAPLGIPICGNFPSGGEKTPFSGEFPGTVEVYMHPTVRAVALEGGLERMLLIRMDLIGVKPLLVHRVEKELTEITGYDWSGHVMMGASHTHSSAARLMPGFVWEILADSFFPQHFEQIISGVVEVAMEAIRDLEPGAFGMDYVETDALHDDRRCENPPVQDDRLFVLRFDGADDKPKALVLVHSLHGTVIGAGDLNFSRDALGGVEDKVMEGFDHPVQVMLFQAGTGDMSPDSPPGDLPNEPFDSQYSRIEGLGEIARDLVTGLVPDIETSSEVALTSSFVYAPLTREAIGYEGDEFPFEGGGAYCESLEEPQCWDEENGYHVIENLAQGCLDVYGIMGEIIEDRTLLSGFTIGDVLILSFPGEPVTQCMLNVEENIQAEYPDQRVVMVGYSQDYTGYSTPEEDWWAGAYEASGAIWGPKQGDYLTARITDVGLNLLDAEAWPIPFDQAESLGSKDFSDEPARKPTRSEVAGTVITDAPGQVSSGDVVTFEFTGGDPWLFMPAVYLEQETDDGWEAVTWPGGLPVDGSRYEYFVQVFPDPPYDTEGAVPIRTFTWQVTFPTERPVPAGFGALDGTYRLRAVGRYSTKDKGKVQDYEVISASFTVSL